MPDSKGFYFTTSAWAVSYAIQYYNISTNKVAFVTPGFDIEIVQSGEYKGYIKTTHSEIVPDYGRKEYGVLVSPDGKEIVRLNEKTY